MDVPAAPASKHPRRLTRGAPWPIGRLWVVVTGLLAAVLVPTVFVLWFMSAAMRNERLAVRQRLVEVCQVQLLEARRQLGDRWEAKARLADELASAAPPQAFAAAAGQGLAEAVIIRNPDGSLAYPAWDLATSAPAPRQSAALLQLERDDPAAAQQLYGQAAANAIGPAARVSARIAQARCLAAMGRPREAADALTAVFEQDFGVRDERGRLLGPLAGLLAWQVSGQAAGELADALARRAGDYGDPPMPPAQRRLLMQTLRPAMEPDVPATFDAEALADAYLAKPRPTPSAALSPCGDGLWHIAWDHGRVIGVFRQAHLAGELARAGLYPPANPGTTIRLNPPGVRDPEAVASVAAGDAWPGWSLEMTMPPDLLAGAADRRRIAYLWTGWLAVTAIAVIGVIVAAVITRQLRLAQQKNNLVAAVTHELKTPLSSVRVLVDLLLAGQCDDPAQVREYHLLIARENQRLGRVIDNFLTHSRIEGRKPLVRLAPVELAPIVAAAVEALADRFDQPGCRLSVELPPDSPWVLGDADALTTVLVNLLDNAHKYTGAVKEVAVRAWTDGRTVHLTVGDNGIGIARRDWRRVFKRFYRVDRNLTAPAAGCGLGLSIARYIIQAHGGSIGLESQPGRGSTFALTLRAAPADRPKEGASHE